MADERGTLTAGDLLSLAELRALRRPSALRANVWLGAWLCAHPVGEDLAGYRRRHHLHHRHTQRPDPDLSVAAAWPARPGAWWWMALRDLSGVTAAAALVGWRPWRAEQPWRRLRGPLVANAVILGGLALAGHWVNYHLEHHLLVFVPCWRLPAVHALLLARGHGARMALAPGYAALLRRATTASPPA
jgi:fatty acid desaturase